MKEVNYQYCLDLLKRLNSIKIDGQSLSDYFSFGGYDFWQMRQQVVFTQLKTLSAGGYTGSHSKITIKVFLVFIFALMFSLLSLVFLSVLKKRNLIFSADVVNGIHKNDARIDSIYKFLHDRKIGYAEYFHSQFSRNFFSNLLKRKRWSVYPEAISIFVALLRKKQKDLNLTSDSIFSDLENKFVNDVIKDSLLARDILKLQIKISEIVLRILSIERVFLIDDVRHYWALLIASRKLNIPSFAFQHGHFTKYHVGWIDMTNSGFEIPQPSKYLLWSEYWRDEISRLGSYFLNSNIITASKDEGDSYSKDRQIGKSKINILIPYETDAPKNEVFKYLDKISRIDNVRLFFKIRTDVSKDLQIQEYGIDKIENIQIISGLTGIHFDLVVGVYSTFLYDMIYKLIPVGLLKTSMDYGIGMIANGVAEFINLDSDLSSQIKQIANTSRTELNRRKLKISQSSTTIDTFLEKLFKESEK